MTIRKQLTTAALALAAASTAAAGTAHFDVVTGQSHDGFEVSVTVQESNLTGYDYEFIIENTTHCEDTAITGFYFESGWASFFSSSPFDRNLNLGGPPSYVEGGVTPDIAGWSSSMVSYEVMDQGSDDATMAMGVNSGRSARVAFVATDSNLELADLENALASTGFGIGLRLHDLMSQDPGQTAWALAGNGGPNQHQCGDTRGALPGDPAAVPTPSAALLGLAMLGLAGKRRRRDA